jgi:NADH dehydrogenase
MRKDGMVAGVNGLVTVFGGSGFLGRYVVNALAKREYRVRNAVRRPDLAGHLQPLGNVGQIHSVQANLRYPESVAAAVDGAAAVVNCVGILYESGKQRFDAVQAEGAATVARAIKAAGVRRFVHVSAIGADAESPSAYARSKAEAERAVLESFPDAVIVRPSIIFGREDSFFNRFAQLAAFTPALPLIGGGKTRFQPVFVEDVAEVIARAAAGEIPGGVYELGGPDVRSFRELLEMLLRETGRKRLLVPLPFGLARLKARFLQLLPSPLLTVDQVTLLERDNVVSDAARAEGRTLEGLGMTPASMAAVLPGYLWRYRRGGQFATPTQ